MSENEDKGWLVFVFMPSLLALLLNREKAKGSPLTEQEVYNIRDQAHCVASPPHAARAVAEGRGYEDIDPERAWEEWQEFRKNREDK